MDTNLLLAAGMMASPAPAAASQGPVAAYMDGAGWTVATGSAKATGGTVTKPGDFLGGTGAVGALPSGAGGGVLSAGYGGSLEQWLPLLLIGMVVFKVVKD